MNIAYKSGEKTEKNSLQILERVHYKGLRVLDYSRHGPLSAGGLYRLVGEPCHRYKHPYSGSGPSHLGQPSLISLSAASC